MRWRAPARGAAWHTAPSMQKPATRGWQSPRQHFAQDARDARRRRGDVGQHLVEGDDASPRARARPPSWRRCRGTRNPGPVRARGRPRACRSCRPGRIRRAACARSPPWSPGVAPGSRRSSRRRPSATPARRAAASTSRAQRRGVGVAEIDVQHVAAVFLAQGRNAPPGVVDQLVRADQRARDRSRAVMPPTVLSASTRVGADHLQRGEVGAVVDPVRRHRMAFAMAREERHALAGQRADAHRPGRLP